MNDKKRKSIEYLNRRLLGESSEGNVTTLADILKEDHEHTDEGKMDYIKGALKNLSPNDLDEVYLMVEGLDSEYKPNITKGNYSRSDVNF